MKISEVKIFAITCHDIELWLDRQPNDEVYTLKEISVKIGIPVQSLGKRISNVNEKYRYIASLTLKYYGNRKAIEAMDDYKRLIIES